MLRTKQVYRNKEDVLSLFGLPGELVAFVLGVAVLTAYLAGLLIGGFVGLAIGSVLFAFMAGKPPLWFTYGCLHFVRHRKSFSATTPPQGDLEVMLLDARALYETD